MTTPPPAEFMAEQSNLVPLYPNERGLRRWLLACIVSVFLAVGVGGITRLTESGLSITEWKPVSGVLPPLSEQGWAEALEKFRQIPQAETTHAGITMSAFKWIYWWEWFHRLVARGVGLVFAIPFLWFLVRGQLPPPLRLRLAWLPLLTLGQGVLGWYMVQSGLTERTEVSAYRLAAHLSLALAILVVALWSWADLKPRPGQWLSSRMMQRASLGIAVLVGITVVSGAFVAGLRAGRIFNEFPLMGGQVVPEGYASMVGVWRNAFENPIAAQFHHRVLAIATALLALAYAWRSHSVDLGATQRRTITWLVAAVFTQVTLGIVTLLWAVPVTLGVLHQLTGVVVLCVAVLGVHSMRHGT
ncbi:MAG: COX15/CtaA family protein [Gemmatimonadaceae bacterium]|nr:COX15/CtaA family protein [Gemmatimonadaceae bacterium]